MESPAHAPLPAQWVSIVRAIRFALVCIVLALSILPLLSMQYLAGSQQFFRDFLGGRPLPPITEWAMQLRGLFTAFSLIIPLTAFAMLFVRSLTWPFYVLGGLVLVGAFESLFIFLSLTVIYLQIFQGMMMTP